MSGRPRKVQRRRNGDKSNWKKRYVSTMSVMGDRWAAVGNSRLSNSWRVGGYRHSGCGTAHRAVIWMALIRWLDWLSDQGQRRQLARSWQLAAGRRQAAGEGVNGGRWGAAGRGRGRVGRRAQSTEGARPASLLFLLKGSWETADLGLRALEKLCIAVPARCSLALAPGSASSRSSSSPASTRSNLLIEDL
jgi:hypothetical protein